MVPKSEIAYDRQLKAGKRFSKPSANGDIAMQRLILLRHAKTEAWYEGVDDHGRALTAQGHDDCDNLAAALETAGWAPDLALVSTARRTRETWAHLAHRFMQTVTIPVDDLYLASAETLGEVLATHQDRSGTILMLGHNPGLHDFACDLLRQAGSHDDHAARHLRNEMPTGCAALFDAGEETGFVAAHFRLFDVIRVRDLRRDSEA